MAPVRRFDTRDTPRARASAACDPVPANRRSTRHVRRPFVLGKPAGDVPVPIKSDGAQQSEGQMDIRAPCSSCSCRYSASFLLAFLFSLLALIWTTHPRNVCSISCWLGLRSCSCQSSICRSKGCFLPLFWTFFLSPYVLDAVFDGGFCCCLHRLARRELRFGPKRRPRAPPPIAYS